MSASERAITSCSFSLLCNHLQKANSPSAYVPPLATQWEKVKLGKPLKWDLDFIFSQAPTLIKFYSSQEFWIHFDFTRKMLFMRQHEEITVSSSLPSSYSCFHDRYNTITAGPWQGPPPSQSRKQWRWRKSRPSILPITEHLNHNRGFWKCNWGSSTNGVSFAFLASFLLWMKITWSISIAVTVQLHMCC